MYRLPFARLWIRRHLPPFLQVLANGRAVAFSLHTSKKQLQPQLFDFGLQGA